MPAQPHLMHSTVYYYSNLSENNACSKYYPDANKWCFLEVRALADFIRYDKLSDKEMRLRFFQCSLSRFILSCKRYATVLDKKQAIIKIKETIELYDDYLKDIEAFIQNEADDVQAFNHCDIALKRDAGAIYDDLNAAVNLFRRKIKLGFRCLIVDIKRPIIYRF